MRKRSRRFLALASALVLTLGAALPSQAASLSLYPASLSAQVGAKTGWVTKSGKKYYYKDGKKLTGLQVIQKKTYIFSKKGVLLTSQKVYQSGKKYYSISKKGVATAFTGTSALAAKVLLSKKVKAATVSKWLRNAFDYAVNIEFLTIKEPANKSESSMANYYGKIGLSGKPGDCSVQAYTFYWLAKLLGYEVKVINGYYAVNDTYKEHSWVEMYRSGKGTTVFDPNFAKEYAEKLPNEKDLGYNKKYGASKTLPYCRADKTEIEKNTKA